METMWRYICGIRNNFGKFESNLKTSRASKAFVVVVSSRIVEIVKAICAPLNIFEISHSVYFGPLFVFFTYLSLSLSLKYIFTHDNDDETVFFFCWVFAHMVRLLKMAIILKYTSTITAIENQAYPKRERIAFYSEEMHTNDLVDVNALGTARSTRYKQNG